MLPFIRGIMAPRKVAAEQRAKDAKDRVTQRNPERQKRVLPAQLKGRNDGKR